METIRGLPLDPHLNIGFQLVLPPPGYEGSAVPGNVSDLRRLISLLDEIGMESVWSGDHVVYAGPILDPLIQLAQVAALSSRLQIGTGVYLLPLRHPASVAKQAGTLDIVSDGRLIFGVGVGGEFPIEFKLCGVPLKERGPRLSESISILKQLWSGSPGSFEGRFYNFPEVSLEPRTVRAGGPPIWCGARADVALRRAGQLADGWISYVVTPDRYRRSLETIAGAARDVGRSIRHFGTGHLLFMRLDSDRENALEFAGRFLSARYAMDFRRAAERYCALGTPEDVASNIREFYEAGMRHVVLHVLANEDEKYDHLELFAEAVLPRLRDLR